MLRALMLAIVLVGCTNPTGSLPPAASAGPGSSPSVDCGPLAGDSCSKAVVAAVTTFTEASLAISAIRIVTPSALMTCPPSGGPAGSAICDVLVVFTIPEGEVAVALVRTSGGWIRSDLIR